jgi:hypothetical protein
MTRDSHKWQNATVAKPKRKYATRKAAGDLRRDIERGIEFFWKSRPRPFQATLCLNGQKLK